MKTYPSPSTQTPSKELRTPEARIPFSPVSPSTQSKAPFLSSSSTQTLHVEPLCQTRVPLGSSDIALVWWFPDFIPLINSTRLSNPKPLLS
ncbi:MAG TPA: hypothetical protein EYQ58_06490 [Candidatus Poseidoniales archaeon]|nr:hypothetical protein [Candidatus Poseidoniales archaeon]